MKFTFNTGRQYQPKGHQFAGQVIEVELVEGFGNVIKFWDRSRGLDGAFYCVHVGMSQAAIETVVMNTYDHNRHQSIDYFEYLQKEQVHAIDDWSTALNEFENGGGPL